MNKTLLTLLLLLLMVGAVLAILHITDLLPYFWFEQPPTNLLIIVSDALRADVPGCYGGAARTPHLDWLARNGTLFETWYSTTPWTLPSSVVMFTGNYPSSYDRRVVTSDTGRADAEKPRRVYHVPDQENLLSEALKDNGYEMRTVLQNSLPGRSNILQGFEEREIRKGSTEERQRVSEITGMPEGAGNHIFTVLEYLLDLRPRQSFCTLFWILDPHDRYNPAEKFKAGIEVDATRLSRKTGFFPLLRSRTLVELGPTFNSYDRRYLKDLYLAELESVDERVGFVLEALKKNNLLDRTLIVFTSDHGECFGEHGYFTHGHNYHEEVVRVPMIMAGPGVPAGRRVADTCSHLGLMPTLKELLGLSFDDSYQGRSYLPLIKGEPAAGELEYLVASHTRHYEDALVMDGYKLLVKKGGAAELYYLLDDPDERHDLARQQPRVVERLRSHIMELRRTNQERMMRNKELDPNLDLEKEQGETEKQMKALGYVE